jgi:hypothetical protein
MFCLALLYIRLFARADQPAREKLRCQRQSRSDGELIKMQNICLPMFANVCHVCHCLPMFAIFANVRQCLLYLSMLDNVFMVANVEN